MPKLDGPPRYQVFMLRAWEESSDAAGPTTWRFSVEAPDTGQRRGFASLEALVAYLANQFGKEGLASGELAKQPQKED